MGSRRRSCAACIRAKTRCVWSADVSLDACTRCNKRGAKCEHDIAIMRLGTSNQAVDGSKPATPVQEGPGADVQESSTALVLNESLAHNQNISVSESGQIYQYMADANHLSLEDNLYINFDEIPALGLDIEIMRYQETNLMSAACSKLADIAITGTSYPTPWAYQPSNTSLFTTRAFIRPDHVSSVSLAMRILRSYPSMMLVRGRLPPFINRPSCPWAQPSESHHPQQPLINCAKIVQEFKSQTTTSKSWIWGQIWHEQERILAQHGDFDRWELLAALQALLIYCLLRLQGAPVGHSVFDASLLTTVSLVSQALASSVGECSDCSLPEDPALAWRDWVFLESRRRTILIFQILGLLVDISTAVSYFSIAGLVLVPLPSTAALWSTRDFEQWKSEYQKWHGQLTIYGLSETGVLTKIQRTEGGIHSSAVEWEIWSAEVGDLGTLVMIIGELLANQ
ncbi:hypothetical protein HD806DRAFT_486756 [Xylariaceae sp. AK1471]|nr:hypothetical protein HD806DRAFT_486756 [Xylariaceae sp. AK1471]